jgi:hypothetical protein
MLMNSIVTSTSNQAILVLLHDLGEDFALKDLGDLHLLWALKSSKHDGLVLY